MRLTKTWDRVPLVLFMVISVGSADRSLNRTKRQQSILCLGDAFITEIITTIIDRNRASIRASEPVFLGGCQEYGVFRLCRGRADRISEVMFHNGIKSECDDIDRWARFLIPIAIQDFTFTFDITYPLAYAGGILRAQWKLVAADLVVYWPTNKRESGLSPVIDSVQFTADEGLTFTATGAYPLSTGLRFALSILKSVLPDATNRLLAVIVGVVFQQFIDGYYPELPF